MPKLYFRVESDWEKVVQLREEISKLETQMKSMDANKAPAAVATLNRQINEAQSQLKGMVSEASKAAVVMDGDFKSKIYQGSQAVNDFTQKIISQKSVVKDVEADVRRLTDAYRSVRMNPLKAGNALGELNAAKRALNEEKSALFDLTQQQANARLSVKKLQDEYALYNNNGKQVVETNNDIAISWKKALGVIGGVAVLKQLGSEIIRVRGEFQAADTAIQTLLGSKEKADALMAQVREYAKISPLEFSDVTSATQMMLGFNIEAERVPRYLQAIGDVSMGNTQKFNSLTLAFSQMSAAGKLMGQDLNQMINAGFNPLQIMSEKTGKSIATLKDEMSKGAISAEMVQQAFIDATSAGGRFYNMSENASKEINGQLSMMQDALDSVFNELGQKSEGVIMDGIQMTTSLIENYETVGKVLAGLVVTYGTYRTAVMLTTIATSKHTIAEVALTNARILARKAQLALNAAMLTNPYVLLATAVVGLGAAMWAFHDSTTESEKAQGRFNKKQKEAAKQEQEHKEKIDSLVESSRDIALADLQRGQSLAELRKEYPKIFSQYDIETIKLADILKLKRQIADEDAKRAGEKKEKELSDLESEIKYYENLLKTLSGQQGVDGYVKKLKELRADRDVLLQENGKVISEQFISNLKNIDINEFDHYIFELEKRIKGKGENGKVKLRLPIDAKGSLSEEAIYDLKDIKTLIDTAKTAKKTKEEAAKAEKKSAAEWLLSYKKAYDDAEKAYKDFLSSKKIMSDADRDKELKRLKDLRDTAKATYERKGGSTSSDSKQDKSSDKLREQQEKLSLLLNKQALEQKRATEDLQTQTDQARIDAMREGSIRTLEQMQLDHKKEMQQLERQQEDILRKKIEDKKAEFDAGEDEKATKDSKYKRQTFDGRDITLTQSEKDTFANQKMYLDLKQVAETQAYLDKERQTWNDYLAEYGTFQEKKEAIAVEYRNKIAKASTEGEKASLKKESENKIKEVNFEELKSSINFADIFGNLDSQSTEAITRMRDKLKEIINKSAKDLKPTDLKALQDAFKDIELKISERNPFGELKQGADDYKNATQAVIKAQEDLNIVQQGGEVIIGTYIDKTGKLCTKLLTQEQAEKNLSDAQMKRLESQGKLTKAVNSIGQQGQQLVNAGNNLVDMLTNLGVEVPESISGALAGLGQIMSGLESIDLTKPFSVISSTTGILSGFVQTITSFFGGPNGTSYYEGVKEQLEAINEVYDRIINKSREEITFGGGFASVQASTQALDNYYKKVANLQTIADASGRAGASWKSHSAEWHSNKNVGAGNFEQMSQILGKSIQSMDDLYYLTGDELYLIQSQLPEAWSQIDSRIKENLQSIIDCKDEANELRDALNQAMTGIDFDSFYSGFIDQLSDIDTSFEDMCDNFEGYLRKSIMAGLVASQYQGRIENLYQEWSDAARSDNKITEDEADALQDRYKQIVLDMMKDREEMFNSFGWDSGSSSQESTKKGFATASQDSIDELNGRFSAGQIAWEETKNQSILQSQSLNILTVKADAILSINTETRNIADDTRDLIAQSYLELVQISENTGNSAKYLKDIKADIAEVKRNTSKL